MISMEKYVLVNKCLQMSYTWVCHNKPESKRQSYELETHSFSNKENILEKASKESHIDNLLEHENAHHNWFPWKRPNCKQCFLLAIHLAKFTWFIEWPLYDQ